MKAGCGITGLVLSELKGKKMVDGLPQVEIPKQLCVECCVSKQPRNSFKLEIPIKSKRKLEVIYYDVCDPFEDEVMFAKGVHCICSVGLSSIKCGSHVEICLRFSAITMIITELVFIKYV